MKKAPHPHWHILKTEDVSPHAWFPVLKDTVQLPNNTVTEYYKSNLPPVAMIVAITQEKEVVFVEQYKHGIAEVCLEFPAGRVEKSHTPSETAVKELLEETGIKVMPSELKPLGELWPEPSKSMVRVHGFLVENVSITHKQQLEVTEDISVVTVPLSELPQLLSTNAIHASDTLALLYLAQVKFPEVFRS